ncbi:MAG TPA: diacylglycerol kinase family protein [Steroidobacteraceae bacterium]|nr:diacylglycerol kinase family protein [Steroidobacteraceae bacterium]
MTISSDRRLFIVMNSASGHDDGDEAIATVTRVLDEGGRSHELLLVDDAAQLDDTARRAVAAARNCGGVVVAAGGDGTLNAVARAVLGQGVPYGVIPQGTFNYFARAHDIPTETEQATQALLDAEPVDVPVGLVNGKPFLVNASLGLYPEALDIREEQKQLHGRSRLVALWATLLTVLRGHHPMRIRLERDGRDVQISTLTLFVGLNPLQLEQMGWTGATAEEGQLAAVVLRPVSTLRLLWLMLRGAVGRLPQAHGVDSFAFARLNVTPVSAAVRRVKVATDGETELMEPPLEFTLAPEPLPLLKRRPARPE